MSTLLKYSEGRRVAGWKPASGPHVMLNLLQSRAFFFELSFVLRHGDVLLSGCSFEWCVVVMPRSRCWLVRVPLRVSLTGGNIAIIAPLWLNSESNTNMSFLNCLVGGHSEVDVDGTRLVGLAGGACL